MSDRAELNHDWRFDYPSQRQAITELAPNRVADWYRVVGLEGWGEWIPVVILGQTPKRVKVLRLDTGKVTHVESHNLYELDHQVDYAGDLWARPNTLIMVTFPDLGERDLALSWLKVNQPQYKNKIAITGISGEGPKGLQVTGIDYQSALDIKEILEAVGFTLLDADLVIYDPDIIYRASHE